MFDLYLGGKSNYFFRKWATLITMKFTFVVRHSGAGLSMIENYNFAMFDHQNYRPSAAPKRTYTISQILNRGFVSQQKHTCRKRKKAP
jgi:hypothetical protein